MLLWYFSNIVPIAAFKFAGIIMLPGETVAVLIKAVSSPTDDLNPRT
jgi:hypothetical protein